MAALFHGYCKFLQQKTHGMSKQLPNKSNKTQWVCPQMGYAQHHISPSFRKKKVCPILRHARVFCTETLPNFLHHWRRRSSSPGRNVFHVCPCYKEQDMHQWHQHVQRHATPCNAMQRHCALFPLKTLPEICWDLRSALDLRRLYWKTLSFSQQLVFEVFDIFVLENGWKRCLRTKRSCENTKSGTKQSDNLHRFC